MNHEFPISLFSWLLLICTFLHFNDYILSWLVEQTQNYFRVDYFDPDDLTVQIQWLGEYAWLGCTLWMLIELSRLFTCYNNFTYWDVVVYKFAVGAVDYALMTE